jgi:hypothetical protein
LWGPENSEIPRVVVVFGVYEVALMCEPQDAVSVCTDVALELGTDDRQWIHHLLSQYRKQRGLPHANYSDDMVLIRAELRAKGF